MLTYFSQWIVYLVIFQIGANNLLPSLKRQRVTELIPLGFCTSKRKINTDFVSIIMKGRISKKKTHCLRKQLHQFQAISEIFSRYDIWNWFMVVVSQFKWTSGGTPGLHYQKLKLTLPAPKTVTLRICWVRKMYHMPPICPKFILVQVYCNFEKRYPYWKCS